MEENKNIPKSVEIMRRINSKEFSDYFYKNIYPKVIKYEKIRPIVYALNMLILIIFLVACVGCIIICYFAHNDKLSFGMAVAAVLLMFLPFILTFFIPSMKKIQQKMKYEIFPLLLNFIGNDFRMIDFRAGNPKDNIGLDKNNITQYSFDSEKMKSLETEIKQTKLFSNFNMCRIDDYIQGSYNSHPIVFSDIDLKYESDSGRNSSVKVIFQGLLIKYPIKKKFTCDIVVKPNSMNPLTNHNNRVHLEDPVFEKYFDVYADNQIEARYILTTNFMNRLVNIAAKKGVGNISCSFVDGYMYLALNGFDLSGENGYMGVISDDFILGKKDWFDIPSGKSFSEIGNWQRVLVDFIDVFRIIDELKVEQNIGM